MVNIFPSIDSICNVFEGQIKSLSSIFTSPLIEESLKLVKTNKYTLTCGLVIGSSLLWYQYCDVDLSLLISQLAGSSPRIKLANKVIWITGASSGIGEALAYELASNVPNCKLVLTGTNEIRLNQVSSKCKQLSKSQVEMTLVIPMDMKEADSLTEGALEKIKSTFGTLDILVANAGRSQRALFSEVSTDVDREMFQVNVFGAIKITRSVINYWKSIGKKDATIAVSSSVAGKFGVPFSCTYNATKGALHGYFECLRVEEYPWLSIVLICPGPIKTPVIERAFTSAPGKVWGKKHANDSDRISSDRCAKLYTVAMANKLDEVWISRNPILLTVYGYQYCPSFMRRYFTGKLSSAFVKLRDGEVSISKK